MSTIHIQSFKAFIDTDKCVGCGACISACPAQAIIMKPGWISYVQEDKCIGCGKCAALCHKNAPFIIHL
ncbi:MAG: ATP-binding protein [Coprococcus sp.]